MKNIIYLILAATLGGFISFGLSQKYGKNQPIIIQESTPQATLTSSISSYPTDFVTASDMATQSVVHIRAKESEVLAQQRYEDNRRNRNRSPFGDTFNMEDFFGGNFFGQRFHQQKGSGSGVIASSDGYIITNNHVVGFADNILVTLNDGREFEATKIGTDPSSDIAMIKIEAELLPAIEFGDSDKVRVGEWVLAAGNPFDYLTSTVTAGIVSAKGRDIDIIKGQKAIEEFIQTDAAVNPGNSGGALVNTDGKLVGINTAIATPTGVFAGYSFAIPSNLVKQIMKEIIESGDIERASLGIYIKEVSELLNEGIQLDRDYGVVIDEVSDRSSAQYAGLLPGDIIVGIDNAKIDNFDSLKEALKFAKVGDTVNVKIVRDNAQQTIRVKLRKGI